MKSLAQWCFTHRRIVVGGWLLAAIAFLAMSSAAGSDYKNVFNLGSTDSQKTINLLKANFPAVSGENDQIVLRAKTGSITDPGVRSSAASMLDQVAKLPHVASVASPYQAANSAQISKSGTIAFATVTLDKQSNDLPAKDLKNIIRVAQGAESSQLHVALGGQGISHAEQGSSDSSVIVGIIAALIVMVFVFSGALLAALMPLFTAVVALLIGTSAVGLFSHVFNVATFATTLSLLIGLGVGVDYGLFITSRHRAGVRAGKDYQASAVQAINTSGRSVLFAGLTVCIALLGLFALGVNFLYGVAISAAFTVLLTMLTSLTLLPAMFGFLGSKVLSKRERRALETSGPITEEPRGFWLEWAKGIEGKSLPTAAVGLALLIAIAAPIVSLRLGASDAGSDNKGQTTRQAYDLLAEGFGPGFNGPFTVATELKSAGDPAAFTKVLAAAANTPGVISVSKAVVNPKGTAAIATIYPAYSPQAKQTSTLVHTLRNQVFPKATAGTGLVVHLGGTTPSNVDFAKVLAGKLPLFIGVVVVLAFLLLILVFRSLLIPLVASIMNLFAVAAALGLVTMVFQWGWGASLISVSRTGPLEAFVPVLMFAILFGLSMDYEVFLVSRMHEEWNRHHNNRRAITYGQANTGRVITAAATIMILVFGSFIFGGEHVIKEFGLGLAGSVLIDAFIIRTVVVPSLMHLIGDANWWVPAWLDRTMPHVSVEADNDPEDPDISDKRLIGSGV